MPLIAVADTHLYFEDSRGSGPPVVFAHGLLGSCRHFDAQVRALAPRYRCIAYDHRGQGRSDVPAGDAIDVETLYADALGLLAALDLPRAHFVGLGLGGLVGLRLAARHPDRIASLAALATAPEPGPRLARYRRWSWVARRLGHSRVAGQAMPVLFGKTFLRDPERAGDRQLWRQRLGANEASIHKAVRGVIERPGLGDELARVDVPVLVLLGEEDVAVEAERVVALHRALPRSRLVRIPGAGHTMTVEAPHAVNAALTAFLDRHHATAARPVTPAGPAPDRIG